MEVSEVGPTKRAGDRPHRVPSRSFPGAGFGCVLVHETGRGAVAWLRGDLDRSAAPVLLQHLIEILSLPLDRLTLDLAEVRFVDEHGATAINVARKRAMARKIDFVLDSMTVSVRAVLDVPLVGTERAWWTPSPRQDGRRG